MDGGKNTTASAAASDEPNPVRAFKTFCGLLYHRAAAEAAAAAVNLDPIEIRITSQYCSGL